MIECSEKVPWPFLGVIRALFLPPKQLSISEGDDAGETERS